MRIDSSNHSSKISEKLTNFSKSQKHSLKRHLCAVCCHGPEKFNYDGNIHTEGEKADTQIANRMLQNTDEKKSSITRG